MIPLFWRLAGHVGGEICTVRYRSSGAASLCRLQWEIGLSALAVGNGVGLVHMSFFMYQHGV